MLKIEIRSPCKKQERRFFARNDKIEIIKNFLDRLNFARSDFSTAIAELEKYFETKPAFTADGISK